MSLFGYILSEVTRSYKLEHDQEQYASKREKMYSFMSIPWELEKFMSYGFFHCLDSFLFIFTFLPLRVLLACVNLMFRCPLILLGLLKSQRVLYPAEIIDLLKFVIIGSCCYAMSYVDTSMLYHMIKSQSVIKLYLMYNMIEVADRLFSAFGQDTIDALFWTATEPRGKKREHIGIIPHVLLAVIYVFLHAMLVLLQATTLNVAINASNKALLAIMMSNNFVELKGSVFKKFDKNNLFQVSCSDVRERFHLFALLFVVVVQTMKEYGWQEDSFWSLAPDCVLVLGAEVLVDWLKHAFITRFNNVPADVYKDYTISLAYDLAQTKQKKAFSDHSDIVSRRMGFIPLPLGVVMLRVVYTSVKSNNPGTWAVVVMAFLCLITFRILGSIVILGKACDLIDEHQSKQDDKKKLSQDESPIETSTHPLTANAEVETVNKSNEIFQLPTESSRVEFLFQNSCVDDRADEILTNTNSPMETLQETDEIHFNRCRHCRSEDECDQDNFDAGLKVRSMSSPDLVIEPVTREQTEEVIQPRGERVAEEMNDVIRHRGEDKVTNELIRYRKGGVLLDEVFRLREKGVDELIRQRDVVGDEIIRQREKGGVLTDEVIRHRGGVLGELIKHKGERSDEVIRHRGEMGTRLTDEVIEQRDEDDESTNEVTTHIGEENQLTDKVIKNRGGVGGSGG